MYLAHFGLKEFPFGLTPDTSYFFPGAGTQAALNTLLIALDSGEGLIKIIGEVGSGKTLLCRYLLNQLEQKGMATAYIPNPHISPIALNQTLLIELGGDIEHSIAYGLTRALEIRLLELAQSGKPVVVLIDEAQAMPLESLEALRLITNLETEKQKLLQIVLFGQPELDQYLDHPSVQQIKSRIAFHDRIMPLTSVETPVYLMHRVTQAGSSKPLFTPSAAQKLHKLSQGMPRLLNILAHKTLLITFGKGRAQAEPRQVLQAGRDTPGAHMAWWDYLMRTS